MVGQGGSEEPDNWILMVVIQPNISWGVQKEKLVEVKEELVKLGVWAVLIKNYSSFEKYVKKNSTWFFLK